MAGSIATSAAPVPGTEIAEARRSVASRWASASIVSVMSAPSGRRPRSSSMIEANSFSSPIRRSFSEASIPIRPASTKL